MPCQKIKSIVHGEFWITARGLQPLFLVVVHIKKKVNAIRVRTELRHIRLVILLVPIGKVTDQLVLERIVPFNDGQRVLLFRVLAQPLAGLVVRCARGNELLKMFGRDSGE